MTRNPFAAISDSNPHHAMLVAQAFVVAHTLPDVWPVLRFVNRSLHHDIAGYLYGCHFVDWHTDCHSGELDQDCFGDLQDMAHAYLDGRIPLDPSHQGVMP